MKLALYLNPTVGCTRGARHDMHAWTLFSRSVPCVKRDVRDRSGKGCKGTAPARHGAAQGRAENLGGTAVILTAMILLNSTLLSSCGNEPHITINQGRDRHPL